MKSKISPFEKYTLTETQFEIFKNSRLACGIKLKPWMNEMIITQPRHSNPLEHDINNEDETDTLF